MGRGDARFDTASTRSVADIYKKWVWKSMDLVGVRDSIQRKFVAAIVLQYLAVVALIGLPVVFLGPSGLRAVFPPEFLLLTGLVIVLASVAFLNTVLIVREDILEPIIEMRDVADRISAGQFDCPPSEPVQQDETGDLNRAFVDLYEYLTTISAQAAALRRENFDAPVLDEEIPGELGASLQEMQETLQRRIRDLRTFREAIEQVGTGIAVYDEGGVIEYANSAYAEMLGTTPENLEGKVIWEVNPAFESERFAEYWTSFAEGESRHTETVHRRLDDGEEFPVETTTTRVHVEDRVYNVGTIEDISDRIERERRLRELHEATGELVTATDRDELAQLTANAAKNILGYDSAVVRLVEDTELRPVAVTEQAQSELGDRPSYPVQGDSFPATVHREGEPLLVEDLRGCTGYEQRDGMRSAMYLPIGQYGVLSITDAAVDAFDQADLNLASVLASNTETALKRLEREREIRRQNDRLEKFGRTVAHDLRNPINVIEGYLDVATLADDPQEAHEEIQIAVDRMSELVDDLLDLAKQGKTVLDPEPSSLEATARDAWEQVDTAEMTLTVEEDVDVRMDRTRIQQVFENLFRNACEHAGSDASITVGRLEDGFYVADDGPGIPPEMRDSVFDSGVTTEEDGTGFGLTIVRQIAAAHDWTVEIAESDAGGTRFEFRGVEFA